MAKIYTENYLKTWSKQELIEHVMCLQHNLQQEEQLNTHMYKAVTQAMQNSPAVSKELTSVLDIWNSSAGHRYSPGGICDNSKSMKS